MTKELRFFMFAGKWYADVPNHTLEENEMVLGSDIALEILSEGTPEVTLVLSDTAAPDYLIRMYMVEHDSEGAWYQICGGTLFEDMLQELEGSVDVEQARIWICNVTHDVFGEHPEQIYIIDTK